MRKVGLVYLTACENGHVLNTVPAGEGWIHPCPSCQKETHVGAECNFCVWCGTALPSEFRPRGEMVAA